MALAFPIIKKATDNIINSCGLSFECARDIVMRCHNDNYIKAAASGDMSSVPDMAAAAGVDLAAGDPGENISQKGPAATPAEKTGTDNSPEKISGKRSAPKTARNASRTKEKKTSAQNTIVKDKSAWGVATSPAAITEPDQLEHVQGDILPADCDGLPDGLADMIYSAVDTFCKKHDFENMSKCRQTAWSACCQFIGQTVFKPNRKILAGPPPKNGGFCYDTDKLSSLADLWSHMCGVYGKAPIVDDFANFAGVDEVTIYASTGKYTDMQHLTPARVRLLQKLHAIQEKGLAGLIVDGRQNPTGALAALNHWHGWTQTREIIHTAGQGSQAAAALPVFGPAGEMLPEKTGDN